MTSISNLIKFVIILALFLCCQIQATTINNDNSEMMNLDHILDESLTGEQDHFDYQPIRRASLRYHPHILYKKASLKPIIGQNGKITFSKRVRT